MARINGGTCMPGNMALGAAGDADLISRVAKGMREEINALGINVNFVPDIDVTEPETLLTELCVFLIFKI